LKPAPGLVAKISGAIAFRYLCFVAMTALALWAEYRPAPRLPDLLLEHVPYVDWADRANYLAWLILYVPLSLVFLATDSQRWLRYMVSGGIISLVRGVCIAVTGLGAPRLGSSGAGVLGKPYAEAFIELINPIGVFVYGSARAYLTQDLFFSGHTATTFLLALYLSNRPRLRLAAWAAHLIVVLNVLMAHLHYTIDFIGAYAITFAIYTLRENRRSSTKAP
jgi:hypothetical protein